MSIRNLFDGKTPIEVFSDTPETIREDGESLANVSETWEDRKRFIPQVDFSKPENFARYGLAEKYYEDSIRRIYEDYPYDGSSREKQQFQNESTYMDLWLLANKYPRRNGYVILSADGWGTNVTSPSLATQFYGEPTDKEYISFVGGPHTSSEGMLGKKLSSTFDDSNKYSTNIYDDAGFTGDGSRESNLKTNFDNGVTVEFWLKKDAFDNSKTQKEVVFDLWNNVTSSAASYGRILLQVTGTAGSSPFILSVQSGSTAIFEEQAFGTTLSTASLQTFGHYAFRIYNSASACYVDFYNNGVLLETQINAVATPSEITGALHANIGALTSPAVISTAEYGAKGWGKLSGSVDEFRFWKTKRSSKQIGRYWFTQVEGGANDDVANASLGVYYKFNEGISGITSIDSTTLDYSGRITNGSWTGYGSNSRSTSSAMVLAGAASSEFKDPVIYSENPAVVSLLAEMKSSGSYHDYNNVASLYNTLPSWVVEQDQQESGYLKELTQIMSSYLDTLYLEVDQLNTIKNVSYVSSSNKEIPFANELLNNSGFIAPNMFTSADLLNQIFSRDETKNYEEDLFGVKNLIYKNVYNNVVDIYKSKGTEKSFRNLIRCYGVDENLVRINAYANNLTYDLSEDYKFTTAKKRLVDFYRPDTFNATIYQQTASSVPNSVSFISASQGSLEDYTSFTTEAEFILPKKKTIGESGYYPTPFTTSSILGFHTADSSDATNFTWPTNDYDLQLYTVKPNTNGNLSDGYFLVTSSYYGVALTSSVINGMYDNRKWNVALRVSPSKNQANLVSGSATTNYTLEFYALNTILDTIQEEVSLSTEITSDGEKLLNEPKRIYAGAHRQDFTGSSLHRSDIKLSHLRYWTTYLDNTVIKSHGRDTNNFGADSPYRNSYNFVTSLTGTEIPEMETLALQWRFDKITTSDAGGGVPTTPDAGFTVLDYSSGSSELTTRYSWMGNVIGQHHTGRADFMYPNDTKVINVEFIPTAKQNIPEVVNAYDTVKIFNIADEQLYTRQSRPTNFYYSVEKSMYAAITEEIINYFASILDFNNLIGDPVNRYRQDYKTLGKLRSLFFENVENTPNIERYVEYYKWIDGALGQMIMDLFPASAIKQDGIRTVVESHVLERNKYWNKYPTLDLKLGDPEAGLQGINKLSYDWQYGHHPVDDSQNSSCFWWKNRAERDQAPLATGISGVDSARQQILSVTLSALNRSYTTPLRYSVQKSQIITSGLTLENNKRELVRKSVKFGNTGGILAKSADVKDFSPCTDDSALQLKKKFAFKAENEIDSDPYLDGKGDLMLPFVGVSSSVSAGYQSVVNSEFKSDFGINNLHIDSYIDSEVPLQGPFTSKYVGGNQHRHIDLNDGTDTALNRPEAWQIEFQSSPKGMKFVHQPVNHPRAMLYRDLVAKRSVNIRNIKTNTASYGIGNYDKDYQIVQTVSRTQNNVAFIRAGGFTIEYIPSPYVAGMDDYRKPQRGRTEWVFVNRFSSPGSADTAGDSNGGPALDPEAAEFSPYNNLNYRNTAVRDPYRLLLASHVNQFGYYSNNFGIGPASSSVNALNYAGTASIYQVNRNPIKQMKDSGSTTITASVYDNYYVQHPIPRSDLQYSWITASATSYDTFGYLPYDGEGDLVTFSTASDFVSYVRTIPSLLEAKFGKDSKQLSATMLLTEVPIYTAYNWMNINTNSPIEYKNSFIGYSPTGVDVSSSLNSTYIKGGLLGAGKASLLNAILLKRNGPYQHPTWKQTRGNENPLVRKWNSSNITAYNLANDTLQVRQDPPVISKYKALRQILKVASTKKSDGIPYTAVENVSINSTFGNSTTLFANSQVSRDLNLSNSSVKLPYDDIRSLYVDGSMDIISNPVQGIGYVAYKEQVYPAAINMYTQRNRARVGYRNTFWKNSREARSALGNDKFGGTNSQGYIVSQSAWALDAAEQFGTGLSTYIAESASLGKSGELQNQYTFAYRLVGSSLGTADDLTPGPIYSRKHTLGSVFSTVNPTGPHTLRSNVSSSTFLSAGELNGNSWPGSTTFNDIGFVSIFGGDAKFQAHEEAGYIKTTAASDGTITRTFISSKSDPFYDKYAQYCQHMRLKNKDMSLIPEFRISEYISTYVNDSAGFTAFNTSSFSIFGVNQSNSETVTYMRDDGNTATYTIQTSEPTPQNSGDDGFYTIYSFSDFMENFNIISEDHDSFEIEKGITLTCKALKKFIAYDGFYPAERTLQIAQEFSSSYASYITASTYTKTIPEIGTIDTSSYNMDKLKMRPLLAPLFAPGVLFNSIKSGIAVDYPIYTSSYETVRYRQWGASSIADYSDYYAVGRDSQDEGLLHYRVQFESLLNPDRELVGLSLYDMEPHPSASLSLYSQIQLGPAVNTYKLAMENFLAEVPNFFLKDRAFTKISSRPEDASGYNVKSGEYYGLRVKIGKTSDGAAGLTTNAGWPQFYGVTQLDDPVGFSTSENMTMYSRPSAFGPPMAGTGSFNPAYGLAANSAGTMLNDSLNGYYTPHTPPYYIGSAWQTLFIRPVLPEKYPLLTFLHLLQLNIIVFSPGPSCPMWAG